VKSLALKLSAGLLVLAWLLTLVGCGFAKGAGGKLSPPPNLPQMAGSWDFTAVGGNGNLVALEAVLFQGGPAGPGDLSGSITVNSFGGPGATTNSAMFEVDISGSSLSTATDMAIDYLGNACGSDDGNRTLAGTINSSSQVALTYNVGGSSTIAINGTFNASATPPFSGSFTVSAPGCKSNGQTGTITGVLASSLTGTYSGTSASDNTEAITMTVTEAAGSDPGSNGITGNGTDSKNGTFTVSAGLLGNFFEGNFTGPGSPYSNGFFFGYFDPQLGAKGSIMLTSFQGGSATTCPNGVPVDNGSCLIAVLALQ
jgi:hypothetical protein